MQNELLLIGSIIFIYGSVLVFYKYFGTTGLFVFTALATVMANIEVLILVNAFGMEQTLGNILFAATFVVTDILSETEGKKKANQAVNIGIITSIFFIVVSQTWLIYIPSESDWASPFIESVFSNTPRMLIVGILVYAIVQRFDVWAYDRWWTFTKKISGDSKKFLWIRNNGSTLISQFFNTVLFTLGAFYGTYDFKTLVQIGISSYIIFVVLSLLDTVVVYLARRINEKQLSCHL
jgi:queuosine precursor transporter